MDWCKQLFPETVQATLSTYETNNLGLGEGFVAWDCCSWPDKWYDTNDGDWKDTDAVDGQHSSISNCLKRIESVTCHSTTSGNNLKKNTKLSNSIKFSLVS